jgi:UDP-N-acetylglucosamine diphosphorylase/glucosamine-1-phosphate N-acetyltransferase
LSEREVAARILPEAFLSDCNIVLFEDEQTGQQLFPMAVLRPAWEIRSGVGCLRYWLSKVLAAGTAVILKPRLELTELAARQAGDFDQTIDPDADTIFLNGRLLGIWANDPAALDLPDRATDADGRVLWTRCSGDTAQRLLALSGNEIARALVQEGKAPLSAPGWTVLHARYVWDYMLHNTPLLMRALVTENRGTTELLGGHALRELPMGVMHSERSAGYPVYICPGAKLMAGTVLGTQAGPIWIGSQTEIEPHTYLEGPLYIGPNCRVKAGTRFYHGVSLGPHCRVAGELSASVLQGYVNKQHEGFLGNSLLGEWVNLGADTRNSNLKNDYSPVKVQVGNELIATGEQFIGLMMGDHTKTGINTMFNTGTVVGVGANVYGGGFPPRFIPSFSWGGAEGMKPGDLERTLSAARFAMPRRGRDLSDQEETLLRRHYAETITRENGS